MIIRIEATDLPGRDCSAGPDFPGYRNIHVAVQGRKGQDDLVGLLAADAESAAWELTCEVVSPPPEVDVRGPQIHGSPGQRFIYLTWGAVDDAEAFQMFRRAKLWLDAIPSDVMAAAVARGVLVGALGLTDGKGNPLCAAVRPPRITWRARTARTARA